MSNNRAEETDLSAPVFGDSAVVDTMVQVERFESVPPPSCHNLFAVRNPRDC